LIRDLNHELRERIQRSPIELNSFGYDPWGFNPDVARRAPLLFALLYRYYFGVQTTGLENLPAGRVLVIPNHAGQIAIDAGMIGVATVLDADPPRPIRGMGEYWLPTPRAVSPAWASTASRPCPSSTCSWRAWAAWSARRRTRATSSSTARR